MTVTLAIDAMGGDFGPSVVIPGLDYELRELSKLGLHKDEVHFLLFGKKDAVEPFLRRFPGVAEISELIPSDCIVTNSMKPLDALRHKDDSNLGLAIQAVAEGRADAVVSAANTGAYVTLATVILGTFDVIDRPAIPAIMPNVHGRSVVLDLGANLECSSERLTQFALMGEALARILFGKSTPTVGLLNVGSEEMKGNPTVQATGRMLHMIDARTQDASQKDRILDRFVFHGFIEGDDIFKGVTDVVVTDGFSGNLMLKGIEGAIRFCFQLIKDACGHSFFGKILAFLLMPILYPLLRRVKRVIDPSLYNGAVFLGLNKIAVKSHGGADAFSFSHAVHVAIQMAQSNFIEDVEKRLHLLTEVQCAAE